jgi:hypothetical protein
MIIISSNASTSIHGLGKLSKSSEYPGCRPGTETETSLIQRENSKRSSMTSDNCILIQMFFRVLLPRVKCRQAPLLVPSNSPTTREKQARHSEQANLIAMFLFVVYLPTIFSNIDYLSSNVRVSGE